LTSSTWQSIVHVRFLCRTQINDLLFFTVALFDLVLQKREECRLEDPRRRIFPSPRTASLPQGHVDVAAGIRLPDLVRQERILALDVA
jgi:hypothetical protein